MSGSGSIHHLKSREFSTLYPSALENVELRGALAFGTKLVSNRRDNTVAAVDDWQDLRDRASAIKADVMSNLDHYLETFEQQAQAVGTHVHWASTPAEARSIITGIAQQHGASLAVKSKSMVSEEIGLNEALEQSGVRPVETDLGEWIVQIANETPSHIVAPALHRSREDVRELFARVLQRPMPEDAEGLTEVARLELRQAFADADIGISGANFLVAETGSFLVLENEGNIRMTTSLPRVHIALVGIEKVLPRLSDLDVFLRLIGRSGTGQKLTSYQTLVTGPRRRADDDGPDEIHVVLLDNSRSSLLGNAVTAQTLGCIRCGACLNTCPVYRQIGGHAYGSVYPGPIGAILTPQLAGLHEASQLPFASSLCGACRDVCPVKIDIPEVLLHLRARSVEEGPSARDAVTNKKIRQQGGGFRMWSWAMRSPWRYRMAGRVARTMAWLAIRVPLVGRCAGPLRGWTAGRSLPSPPRRSFRSEMARRRSERRS
ncbi:MAG: LutB/LldF family L-lactate oxidation iron-sulfur protein [Phycisphaerales bacterium]|nr:LutB/LldF family L-lactate oxidation iron-sulfur protein [Phycisphaerales bacterium]